jgi:hypothetical protein
MLRDHTTYQEPMPSHLSGCLTKALRFPMAWYLQNETLLVVAEMKSPNGSNRYYSKLTLI